MVFDRSRKEGGSVDDRVQGSCCPWGRALVVYDILEHLSKRSWMFPKASLFASSHLQLVIPYTIHKLQIFTDGSPANTIFVLPHGQGAQDMEHAMRKQRIGGGFPGMWGGAMTKLSVVQETLAFNSAF